MQINFTYPDKVITFIGWSAQSIVDGIHRYTDMTFGENVQMLFDRMGWELRFVTSVPPRMYVASKGMSNDMALFPIRSNPDGTFYTEKYFEKQPPISPQTGLTPEEQTISDHLVEAWNGFIKLEKQHPNEHSDFADAMNQCQSTLAMRAVRRTWPEGWPMK